MDFDSALASYGETSVNSLSTTDTLASHRRKHNRMGEIVLSQTMPVKKNVIQAKKKKKKKKRPVKIAKQVRIVTQKDDVVKEDNQKQNILENILNNQMNTNLNEKELTKRELCEEILVQGYVQSYVDFFYLTHRPDPFLEDENETEIVVSNRDMVFIRDQLMIAERARRKGDTSQVYDSYGKLAEYYQELEDFRTGLYFYEKCLEISRLSNDEEGRMDAHHNLGNIYELTGELNEAIHHHEFHEEIAVKSNDDDSIRESNLNLTRVYRLYAEKCERAKNLAQALVFFERTLESSMKAGDRESEANACYDLGRVYIELNEPLKAVKYLEIYQTISKDTSNLKGQGNAASLLASAYQHLRNDEKALEYLHQYVEIAEKSGDIGSQAVASNNLGTLYNKRGEFETASKLFQKNFEASRNIVSNGEASTSIIDKSRIFLGISRGNGMLQNYLECMMDDFPRFLSWKINRSSLTSNEETKT